MKFHVYALCACLSMQQILQAAQAPLYVFRQGVYRLEITPQAIQFVHDPGYGSAPRFIAQGTDSFAALSKSVGPAILVDAAEKGLDNIVRQLLAAGFDIEEKNSYQNFRTPLMQAAAHNNPQAVKLLLKLGANLQATNELGETAQSLTTDKKVKKIIEDYEKLQSPERKKALREAAQKIISGTGPLQAQQTAGKIIQEFLL